MKPESLKVNLIACQTHIPHIAGKPRFSWLLKPESNKGHTNLWLRQSAYQLQIYQGDKRDSYHDTLQKKSTNTVAVTLDITPPPGFLYRWRVRTWNQKGNVSEWSDLGTFEATRHEGPVAIAEPDALIKRYIGAKVITKPADHVTLYDFERAMFGNLLLHGRPGQEVRVRLGEKLRNLRIDTKPERNVRFYEEVVTLGKDGVGVPTLTVKDSRRMPAHIGPVMPFRYVEVETENVAPVRIERSVVTVPFSGETAHFSSSDITLNAVYQLSKDTMEATSFCGIYVDGDRERLPYEADAYINMLGHYCVDRSYATARHTHEFLLYQPTWPTEWILFSVLMAWEDYLHTGDITSIRNHIETIEAKVLRKLARPDGLISTVHPIVPKEVLRTIHRTEPIKDVVDWPIGERDNYALMPVNTVVNTLHIAALKALSRIYQALGRASDARVAQDDAERATAALTLQCFDAVQKRYLDGEGTHHASIHANLFPLAFGLVPSDSVAAVADYVASRGMACSVYAAQFLIDGLFMAGLPDAGIRLLCSRGDRSWGHMVWDVGTTIALEAWDTRYKPNQDWNHAWGAAPANLIPRWIVGVWPLVPGAGRVGIAPNTGQLTSFDSSVPTVRGTVRIQFSQSNGKDVFLVQLPIGSDGSFTVPKKTGKRARIVTHNGKAVPRLSHEKIPLEPVILHRIVIDYLAL